MGTFVHERDYCIRSTGHRYTRLSPPRPTHETHSFGPAVCSIQSILKPAVCHIRHAKAPALSYLLRSPTEWVDFDNTGRHSHLVSQYTEALFAPQRSKVRSASERPIKITVLPFLSFLVQSLPLPGVHQPNDLFLHCFKHTLLLSVIPKQLRSPIRP